MTDPSGRVPPSIAPNALYGMRVIESLALEQDGEPYTVRRTWRERLFGRPWTPLVRTRVVVPRIPYRGAVQLNATTLVMHPAAVRALRETLKHEKGSAL